MCFKKKSRAPINLIIKKKIVHLFSVTSAAAVFFGQQSEGSISIFQNQGSKRDFFKNSAVSLTNNSSKEARTQKLTSARCSLFFCSFLVSSQTGSSKVKNRRIRAGDPFQGDPSDGSSRLPWEEEASTPG